MDRLIFETRRDGCDVWLAADARGMVAEVRRRGALLAKSQAWHWGLWDACAPNPERSGLAKVLMDEAIAKALGRPQRNSFDLLVDEIARGMARPRRKMLIFKAEPIKRAVFFAKAQRGHESVPLRTAGLLSRAHRQEARYEPNAPVSTAVLRRVLAAAKCGVLTAADLQAVQNAHRDGLALPGHVLRKLSDWRQ